MTHTVKVIRVRLRFMIYLLLMIYDANPDSRNKNSRNPAKRTKFKVNLRTFANMAQKVPKVLLVIAHHAGMLLHPEIIWISH